MTLLSKFEKQPKLYELLFISCYLLINNTISTTSILMESSRQAHGISFPLWQPFAWEYSSALSLILLVPLLFIFLEKVPLTWSFIKKNIALHLLGSIVFSLIHIFLMVLFRKIIYISQNLHYEFGEIPAELFYEYRKDIWAYFIFIIIIYSFRFVTSRMIGEAQIITDGVNSSKPQKLERLIVKKLGEEFIIKVEDIEWLESSGNYVNLHIKNRIYPTRSTLSHFIELISEQGFFRIHRSYGVNLKFVKSIKPLTTGDCEIKLESGEVLSLSRRYRDELKANLI